jgi:hypothetical protein
MLLYLRVHFVQNCLKLYFFIQYLTFSGSFLDIQLNLSGFNFLSSISYHRISVIHLSFYDFLRSSYFCRIYLLIVLMVDCALFEVLFYFFNMSFS